MSDLKKAIMVRVQELNDLDSKMRHDALRAVSAQNRPLYDAIRAECSASGHIWKHDHWNFTGTCAWDKCVWCGAMEAADQHQAEEAVP